MRLAITLLLSVVGFSLNANGQVAHGEIEKWCDGTAIEFDYILSTQSSVVLSWNASDSVSGHDNTVVARASDVTDVQEIQDASKYDFRQFADNIRPGEIIVAHNTVTGYYAALLMGYSASVEAWECPYAKNAVSINWYFQKNGTGDFSQK